jgi:hypothetical protein
MAASGFPPRRKTVRRRRLHRINHAHHPLHTHQCMSVSCRQRERQTDCHIQGCAWSHVFSVREVALTDPGPRSASLSRTHTVRRFKHTQPGSMRFLRAISLIRPATSKLWFHISAFSFIPRKLPNVTILYLAFLSYNI